MTDALETPTALGANEQEKAGNPADLSEVKTLASAVDNRQLYPTKEVVLDKLRALLQHGEGINKQQMDVLKQAFYKLHAADVEAYRRTLPEEARAEAETSFPEDPRELLFKELMATLKEKRNEELAQIEAQKEANAQQKQAIIESLKTLVEQAEDPNKSYPTFKELQQQWSETNLLPPSKVNELWKTYHLYCEQFYDLLKLNHEFREYDFKKNLEIKQSLCDAAEKLADESDPVSAFHQLQKLHDEYRETGPVAREQRETIWSRFKTASTVVNKRYQQHFEDLKAKEQENLARKTALCEQIEQIDYAALKNLAAWEQQTRQIQTWQGEWKEIGFAPQKLNVKIFERFRQACDTFFMQKSAFYKQFKEDMALHLAKKQALCEEAERLKDRTEWKETTEAFIRLQKEWKTIGAVPRKHSDALWKRFTTACDYFFEQKNKQNASQKSEEKANLEKSRCISSVAHRRYASAWVGFMSFVRLVLFERLIYQLDFLPYQCQIIFQLFDFPIQFVQQMVSFLRSQSQKSQVVFVRLKFVSEILVHP